MTFTIGCDPEIFVKRNGKSISAHGMIPGTKKAPFKTSRGAVQVDGTALELNTDPVNINDFEGFNTNVVKTLADLTEMVKKFDGGVNLSLVPVQEYDEEYLAGLPEEATELGCDPDYNAYTMTENPRPDGTRLFRTGAGHIHIGWGSDIPVDNEDHFKICADFVKYMDLTVGMLMTVLDRDPRRRELYGKAGAFRPKSYGVEYRTPSNVWLRNKLRRRAIHELTNLAINFATMQRDPVRHYGVTWDDVRAIIDTGDYDRAFSLLHATIGYSTTWVYIKKDLANAKKEIAA